MAPPLGISQLVPRSIRSGKWLAMLVSYLDDSGKDPQNSITCLAGYVASEDTWATFETESEPIFQKYVGDDPLHAIDLHQGRQPFKDWKVLQKQALVAQLCLKLYPLRPLLGVSFSVRKASYATSRLLKNPSQ